MKLASAIIITLTVLVNGQEFGWGPCPAVKPMVNASLTGLAGTWYETGRIFSAVESLGNCPYVKLDVTPTSTNITHRLYELLSLTGRSRYGYGVNRNDGSGNINLNFLGLADYTVLGTDYWSWAAIYGCYNYYIIHFKVLATYSRNRILLFNEFNNAKNAVNASGLPKMNITVTDQLFCLLFN